MIQFHMIKTVPASNLNRGQDGKPKHQWYGGYRRTRVSSQSFKRAIRQSELFRDGIDQDLFSVRTRFLHNYIADHLRAQGASDAKVELIKNAVFDQLGRTQKKKKDEEPDPSKERLFYFSMAEVAHMAGELSALHSADSSVAGIESVLTSIPIKNVDIALFGRMSTTSAFERVDASAQIAHWLSVTREQGDIDYVTAVDDVDGISHLFEGHFTAPTFYIYGNIDDELLLSNLDGDTVLAKQTIDNFTRAFAVTNPKGAQNSYAAHVLPDYLRVERSERKIPISYAPAFAEPVAGASGGSTTEIAIKVLDQYIALVDSNFKIERDARTMINVVGQQSPSTLGEIAEWAAEVYG